MFENWTSPNGARVITSRPHNLPVGTYTVNFDRTPWPGQTRGNCSGFIYNPDGTHWYDRLGQLTPPVTDCPIIGWVLPCGAKVIRGTRALYYGYTTWDVLFDRFPRRLDGARSSFKTWPFTEEGVFGVVEAAYNGFPNLSPPFTADLTKPLQLSDGTPVTLLTDKALGLCPLVIITNSGNLLRCDMRGVIVDDTRKLENVA